MILANHGILSSSGGALSYDADALAFMTAASITDNTQKTAINTLVTDLKGYNIWTKMKALYPFVGGSASSHKFNLKDPRDLDAAYRLVFNGGWTHSSTGVKPNGTTAYANTFVNPTVDFLDLATSNHLSVYVRENIDELSSDIGVGVNPGVFFRITPRYGNIAYSQNNVNGTATSFSNSDSRGFWINTRQSSLIWKNLKNNIIEATASAAITGIPNAGISLGATYNSTTSAAEAFSSKEQAFASIGDGLSDTEAVNFYTAVQSFNTLLARNV